MISQRFSVEFDRRTVGIAVRAPGGFMFYTSDRDFGEMDGRMFPRARAIERQLNKIARRSKAHSAASAAARTGARTGRPSNSHAEGK